jgi:hypothetical protein
MGALLGLLSFVLSIGLALPAAAYCRLTTESPSSGEGPQTACTEEGLYLVWKQQCISYTLVPHPDLLTDRMPLHAVRDTIDASFGSWSALRCLNNVQPMVLGQTVELGECSYAEYNRFGPNANTIAFARDWESRGRDFVPEAYALTLVWHNPDTGEILDADIQINMNKGQLAICEEDACGSDQIDLQNVLTHEAGHFLGLAHSMEMTATMYGDAPLGETDKRQLETDDVDGLCVSYSALPAPECIPADFAPRRGFSPLCAQPMESSTCLVRGPVSGGQAGRLDALAPYIGVLVLIALAGRARGRRRRA